MGKNLFVISGVTGMTGNELARQIVSQGDMVVGFDNFFASSIESIQDIVTSPLLKFFELDINDKAHMDKMMSVVEKLKSDCTELHYINCAAVVHTEHFYHPNATFDTNVLGMRHFLQQAIDQKAASYINCSTSEVYSMQSWNEEGGVREDDYICLATAEHSQRTSYAVGKLMTEYFMAEAVKNNLIRGCSIRFANVYSKYERYSKHIIPHIYESLKNTQKVILLENSKINKRSFLHNVDSCSAVMSLLKTPRALDGSVYNVATDEEITIIALVRKIADKLGVEHPEIVFNGFRESDPERRILNTEKILKRTGWRAKVTLDEGLDLLIQYNNTRDGNGGL